MKFLLVTQTGNNVSIAERVSSEGHHTILAAGRNLGQGIANHINIDGMLITKVAQDHRPDVVVFDCPELGHMAETLRNKGYKTAFSSNWSHMLEKHPDYNQTVINSFGFSPWAGQGGHDVVIEGWFNGNKFLASLLSVVYRSLMNDDIGPDVGCMGSVIWGGFNGGRLYDYTLSEMETPLRKISYRGPVSIDVIISESGVYVKKISAYPRDVTAYCLFEGTKTNVSDVLFALATGEGLKDIDLDEWVASVAITVPPWPYSNTNGKYEDLPLEGVDMFNKAHLWLKDVILDSGSYISRRTSGHLGYVTARGKTAREARRRAYRTISNLKIADLQYRTDIGKDASVVFYDLKSWGWT